MRSSTSSGHGNLSLPPSSPPACYWKTYKDEAATKIQCRVPLAKKLKADHYIWNYYIFDVKKKDLTDGGNRSGSVDQTSSFARLELWRPGPLGSRQHEQRLLSKAIKALFFAEICDVVTWATIGQFSNSVKPFSQIYKYSISLFEAYDSWNVQTSNTNHEDRRISQCNLASIPIGFLATLINFEIFWINHP